MKKIGDLFLKINHVMLWICGVFAAFAALLAAVNAILRFTKGSGFAASDEICVQLVALLVFIGMSYLEYTDNHLTIDIFNTYVKNQVIKKIVLYVRGIITIIFDCILIKYGITVTQTAAQRGIVTNVLHFPRSIIYGIVTASMIAAVASWVVILVCRKGEFAEC